MMKKEMTEEEQKKIKERRIFIARIIAWILLSCVTPVVFIGWRYKLFDKAGSLQLSGWGLIAIIIICVFLYTMVKYIRAGFTEWSMIRQIVDGIVKVILPLAALLAVVIGIRNSLETFIQALSCVLICEVISVPLNPFPEWVWKKSKGRFESTVDYIADRFNQKEKEEKE